MNELTRSSKPRPGVFALRLFFILTLIAGVLIPGEAAVANKGRGVSGTTITVDTEMDEFGTGDSCSLREAIQAANLGTKFGGCLVGGTSPDTIELPAGTYTLTLGGPDENGNAGGDLDIRRNLIINGAGQDTTIIDGGGVDRVLQVFTGFVVTLNDLTIRGGHAPDGANGRNVTDPGQDGRDGSGGVDGGGIYNAGALTLNRVTIKENQAGDGGDGGDGADGGTSTEDNGADGGEGGSGGSGGRGGRGGGIYNKGTLVLNDCLVSGNRAGAGGNSGDGGDGGDGADGGGYKLTGGNGGNGGESDLVPAGNGGDGGGIANDDTCVMTMTHTTVQSNQAGEAGDGGTPGNGGDGGTGLGSYANGNGGDGGPSSNGGDGGKGGGIYGGHPTILSSDISYNTAGEGGSGAPGGNGGQGGAGNTIKAGAGGAGSTGGRGGWGGFGGGIYSEYLLIQDSRICSNQTGNGGTGGDGGGGGPGGKGWGWDGGDGGPGGDGGYGSWGGRGGGIFVQIGESGAIENSTICDNLTGTGGDGGDGGQGGDGGPGGTGYSPGDNGDGGDGGDANCGGFGGGIELDLGTDIEIIGSTISGNQARAGGNGGDGGNSGSAGKPGTGNGGDGGMGGCGGTGGGISTFSSGSVTNSTISGNQAGEGGDGGGAGAGQDQDGAPGDGCVAGRGGGIRAEGIDPKTFKLINTTIARNQANGVGGSGGGGSTTQGESGDPGIGGGVYIRFNADTYPFFTITHTILADNTAAGEGDDCDGKLILGGYNLIEDVNGCDLSGDSSHLITGRDPLLGDLADNGGPTWTHALDPATPSLAVDAGAKVCRDADGVPLTTDQRGPGYPRPVGVACDLGAYELHDHTLNVRITGSGTGSLHIDPPDSDCSKPTCNLTIKEGLVISLTAKADTGSIFAGWNDDGPCESESTDICSFIMDGDYTVEATFSPFPPPDSYELYLPYIGRKPELAH
jgi:CSLREA domain-containing protein